MNKPDGTALTAAFGLPPEQAIEFLRSKGFQISYNWSDVWQDAHAKAFTVSRVTQMDVLTDIRGMVDKALAEGWSVQRFKNELQPMLEAKGWWGTKEILDPRTGERKTTTFNPRRLDTIYHANMQSAYAKGRYDRLTNPDVLNARPYWRYVAVNDGRTRPLHRAWHGTVCRHDDPWWQTHFPPNGWRCRCSVQSMSTKEAEQSGQIATGEQLDAAYGFKDWTDPYTGELHRVPNGIDPGWAYSPGQARYAVDASQFQRAAKFYRGCGGEFAVSGGDCIDRRRIFADVLDALSKSFSRERYDEFVSNILKDVRYPVNKVLAGTVSVDVYDAMASLGVIIDEPHIWLGKTELTHMRHTKSPDRERYTLDDTELYKIPDALGKPEKKYMDTVKKNMLYIFPSIFEGHINKMAVYVNYREKSLNEIGNWIWTADKIVDISGLVPPRYIELP